MIKDTVTESSFIDSFQGGYKDNFSYYGKKALFEYLEQLSEDIGDDIELDPIALCCEYSEYDNANEAAGDYGFIADSASDRDEIEKEALEYLYDNTQVIEFQNDNPFMDGRTSGIIIQQF